ncbi:hypothetical protein ACJX0J_006037, partial [Zea mays]
PLDNIFDDMGMRNQLGYTLIIVGKEMDFTAVYPCASNHLQDCTGDPTSGLHIDFALILLINKIKEVHGIYLS